MADFEKAMNVEIKAMQGDAVATAPDNDLLRPDGTPNFTIRGKVDITDPERVLEQARESQYQAESDTLVRFLQDSGWTNDEIADYANFDATGRGAITVAKQLEIAQKFNKDKGKAQRALNKAVSDASKANKFRAADLGHAAGMRTHKVGNVGSAVEWREKDGHLMLVPRYRNRFSRPQYYNKQNLSLDATLVEADNFHRRRESVNMIAVHVDSDKLNKIYTWLDEGIPEDAIFNPNAKNPKTVIEVVEKILSKKIRQKEFMEQLDLTMPVATYGSG